MTIFVTIALAAFLVLVFSMIFGHDHDFDHSPDMDHEVGDHGGSISIFSPKVIATLCLGFGAVGAIARNYGCSYMGSSLYAVLGGVVVAFLAYLILCFFYKQQASSVIKLNNLLGSLGRVTVSIGASSAGEVGVTYQGQYDTYLAVSKANKPIPTTTQIKVTGISGNQLEVEAV